MKLPFPTKIFQLALMLTLLSPPAAKADPAGVFPNETIKVDGADRHFRLVVPESADLERPAPLVVAFHGMLIDSKDLMPRYTKLADLAAAEGFLLAFPDAVEKSWGIAPAKVEADLAFFDALLVDLKRRYKIDPDRIYVIGMSNGGYFAHLVAKERSRIVAAACSHSGPLGLQTLFGIGADRKFPVMIIHGAKDRIFPVAIARENRDKYRKEEHPVTYVEIPDLGHFWGTGAGINEQIWTIFKANPLR